VTPEPSKHHAHDNIISSEQGTSRFYTVARLKRDRPDLAQRVIDGELSANAATR
jgi:hypothetical protein